MSTAYSKGKLPGKPVALGKPTALGLDLQGSLSQDIAIPTDNCDTISAISWSPVTNHLAAASWDGKTRIYEVARNSSARNVAMINADGPLFSCHWSKDGATVATAGADRKIHILDVVSGQTMSFEAHAAPIRDVRFVDIPSAAAPIIASGSWDKTVRYWDTRNTSQPIFALDCGERVYALDTGGQTLVIATADMKFLLVDLANPTVLLSIVKSPLQHQIQCLSVARDGRSWAAGTIEGRICYQQVDQKLQDQSFSWKCHREDTACKPFKQFTKIWSVNTLATHPTHESRVASCGSDGTISFWDPKVHILIRSFPGVGGAITSCAFDRTGSRFAYAIGYDWSMGHEHNKPDYPTKLMLHAVVEADMSRQVAASKKAKSWL